MVAGNFCIVFDILYLDVAADSQDSSGESLAADFTVTFDVIDLDVVRDALC